MTKKKVLLSLLGGGVAIVLASFGGIEANNKIKHNQKLSHFEGLRGQLNKGLLKISGFEGGKYTMPKWDDYQVWKRHFENETKDSSKSLVSFENPHSGRRDMKIAKSGKELRDICYEMLEQEGQSYNNCNSTNGWCTNCLFERGWYSTDSKY